MTTPKEYKKTLKEQIKQDGKKQKKEEFKKEDYSDPGGCKLMKCADIKDGVCHYDGDICKYRKNTVEGYEELEEKHESLKAENERYKNSFVVKKQNERIEQIETLTAEVEQLKEERNKYMKEKVDVGIERNKALEQVQELNGKINGLSSEIETLEDDTNEQIDQLKQDKAELATKVLININWKRYPELVKELQVIEKEK